MKDWKRVELGNRYYVDADSRQWSLSIQNTKPDNNGEYGYRPVGYYPSLPSLLRALATRRLRETHIDDWQKVVGEIDAIVTRFEQKLPEFWRSSTAA